MVKVRVLRHKKIPDLKREIIDFHPDEIPIIINKLYHAVNTPNKCAYCGKPDEFIRVVVDNMTHVRVFKVCKSCLVKK